ncbi:hypothetical protein VP1G_02602 [Cytospora mali]|uniref:Protamine P1 n=1 Tax=Cytospora mali TaxID=578113 RepID=A0A194UUA5_CYTMA|nr:hypothetical protein VP1G_02602 [Valsa mali var. pyri (nom. inval.)]
MPPQLLHHLGDEPIYCEVVHNPDDDVYSGSDDERYEGPLHRRLHIEKKAIDFLTGHVPVLLSARLRGPFDSQHWNNPWRSRRATTQFEYFESQTTRSNPPVEREAGHGPDEALDEPLPNTQGTSLYPLPSPEITNPPSARKNPYMEEDEYNRVKTWRETVKGTSVSRDPFWLSQQDENSDDVSITRKRPADQQWLHKRQNKKRKPAGTRQSPPEESPSQAASKMRKFQTRQPQLATLSIHTSSAHEDELATSVNTRRATVTPLYANRNIGTPHSRRIERRSPHRKLRLRETESSEDELSMPSTTPTHKAARSYAEHSKTPKDDGSPRRPTTKSTSQFRDNCDPSNKSRSRFEKIQASQSSVRQRSSIDATRRLSQEAARLAVEASCSIGKIPGPAATKNTKPLQTEEVDTSSATIQPQTHANALADTSLSQQDNSFCFHKRVKSPVEIPDPCHSPKDPKGGTTSLLPVHSQVAAAAVGQMEGEHYASHDDDDNDDGASVSPSSVNAMGVDINAKQQIPYESAYESGDIIDAQVPKQIQSVDEVMEDEELAREDENDKTDDLKVVDVTRVDVAATRKPESVHELESNNEAVATGRPQLTFQHGNQSDPEWTTYLNTQDLPSTSATTKAVLEDAHGIQVVEQGIDDSSDLEWSSYVETQDPSAVSPEAKEIREAAQGSPHTVYQAPDDHIDAEWTAHLNTQDSINENVVSEEAGDVLVIEQGLDGTCDLDWSTFVNTQDQSAAPELLHVNLESNYENAMDANLTNPANCKPISGNDDDSDSDWSTCRSASSQVDGDQTDDTRHDPPPEATQDVKSSQASVDSIIDVYADIEQPSGVFGQGKCSIVSNESLQDIVISMPKPNAVEEFKPGQEKGETVTDSTCATPIVIEDAKDNNTEGSLTNAGNFDETTTSMEPRQTTADSMLDETVSGIEPQEVQNQPSIDWQTLQAAESGANSIVDFSLLDQTTTSLEPPNLQSPWSIEALTGLHMPQDPCNETKLNTDSAIVDATTTSTDPLEIQSPWTKETGIGSHQPVAQDAVENGTPSNGSCTALNLSANKVLPFSQPPQSPWMAHTPAHSSLPTPDFTISIKAFSDFATPSPTKKRASFNGSILRDRFKTRLFQKPNRRVHFAPLTNDEDAGNMEVDQEDDDTIYIEEIISGGHKTGNVRVPRPVVRAASPPPKDVSSAEVGGLLDHDSKFAKHFEAMAKRKKNPPRVALRLLPSDSQQTTASQGVGAMAETFIQASQIMKNTLNMTEVDAAETRAADEDHDLSTAKGLITNTRDSIENQENQENVEPVDDVSAVLDNLGEFLDDTWGVGLGAEVEGGEEEETRDQPQPRVPQCKQGARGVFDIVGDPLMALNINVWAD